MRFWPRRSRPSAPVSASSEVQPEKPEFKTLFAQIMDLKDEIERAVRFFDGPALRLAIARLANIARDFPADCDCDCEGCLSNSEHCCHVPCWIIQDGEPTPQDNSLTEGSPEEIIRKALDEYPVSINVIIETDGDEKAIEPDAIEEILYGHGYDVNRVTIRHVDDVTL